MIDFIYKKRGIKINGVWFYEDDAEVFRNSSADVVFFHGIDDPGLKNSVVIPQKSLITDLNRPLQEVFGAFSNACRNKIHKAERMDLAFSVYDGAALKAAPELLVSFKREFDDFSNLKGIVNLYNEAAMEKYVEKNGLFLTMVEKNGIVYARHILISDGKHTRLLHSVSNFRNKELDKKITANANPLLHWKEIEYLHERNFEMYDWGGITNEEEPKGVDFFKMEFRGRLHRYNNVLVAKTLKGKAALLVMKKIG